jgi:hypothetical protein
MRRTHIVDSPEFWLCPPASTGTPLANINDLAAIPEPSKALFSVFRADAVPLWLRGRISLLELGERQRELRSSDGVASFDPGIGPADMRHVVRALLRIVTADSRGGKGR